MSDFKPLDESVESRDLNEAYGQVWSVLVDSARIVQQSRRQLKSESDSFLNEMQNLKQAKKSWLSMEIRVFRDEMESCLSKLETCLNILEGYDND